MSVAKIITHSRVITLAATPESIAPTPGTSELSKDAAIQAKVANTQNCSIGGSGSQDIEIAPGQIISLSDFFHLREELEFDLDTIFCKVGVNGEGVNILRTEII